MLLLSLTAKTIEKSRPHGPTAPWPHSYEVKVWIYMDLQPILGMNYFGRGFLHWSDLNFESGVMGMYG